MPAHTHARALTTLIRTYYTRTHTTHTRARAHTHRMHREVKCFASHVNACGSDAAFHHVPMQFSDRVCTTRLLLSVFDAIHTCVGADCYRHVEHIASLEDQRVVCCDRPLVLIRHIMYVFIHG
jgi:hypothetical protein